MKKIFAFVAIAAAATTLYISKPAKAEKVNHAAILACKDYYANDTTPKKKHKRDTTRRDTTNHFAGTALALK